MTASIWTAIVADTSGVVALALVVAAMAAASDASLLFKLHPVLNALAFGLFMAKTITVYYGPLIPCWESGSGSRASRRSLHRWLSISACVCAAGALFAIISNKIVQGKSLLPRSVHGWCGLVVLALVCVQSFVGAVKFASAEARGAPMYQWHGYSGQIVHALGTAVLVLGIALMMGWESAWTVAIGSAAMINVLMANLHLYWGRETKHDHNEASKESDDDDDGDEGANEDTGMLNNPEAV